MTTQNMLEHWKNLVARARNENPNAELKSKSKDNIKFMTKMGFAPEFIEAAQTHRGMTYFDLEIDWMMSWLQRQNMFFEFRPKMLPIGTDGCGNLIYLYDVSDPDTSVIYYCHDPAVIMVIAVNMTQFLEQLSLLAKLDRIKQGKDDLFDVFMEKNKLSDSSMKIWEHKIYNGEENNLGLHTSNFADKIHVDFSKALPGAGVSLAYFGKYTEIYFTNEKNVISIEKMDRNGVEELNRKDRNATIIFVSGTILCTIVLIAFEQSILKSIFFSLIIMIFIMVIPDYFTVLFKRGPRL